MPELHAESFATFSVPHIPRATYRLQLNRHFNFNQVRNQLPYLKHLGISHLYLSPIFKARANSMHGYDVTDHTMLNPELGSMADFESLAHEAHQCGMGIILDIVPNHMAVIGADNLWWHDVLENGPASQYAHYFDIDWTPARESMRDRLLIPILGSAFGYALEHGEIKITFNSATGAFSVHYHEHQLPLDPREYPKLFSCLSLQTALELPSDDIDRLDFESLLNDFEHLPRRNERSSAARARRYRDKEVLKRRLVRICERNSAIVLYIEAAINKLNGNTNDPSSFDSLENLLEAQAYRLALWRVADDEINYRRFFDVDQLAALRIEIPEVFAAVHELVLTLIAAGHVDGLRIDHIDGLHDPQEYLTILKQHVAELQCHKPPYIVVEKILAADESLNEQWPVQGTTGYEFGALLGGWLTDGRATPKVSALYKRYTNQSLDYDEVLYQSKRLVMRTSLAGELTMLSSQLDRIAQSHRYTTDFTYQALRNALTEVIAAFSIYRTYIRNYAATTTDSYYITQAINTARQRSRASDNAVFDFIKSVLLLDEVLFTQPAQRSALLNFTMKFQQITAPVMAKGAEDTAFYRYQRLVSANEVGSDPRNLNISTVVIHREHLRRWQHWPYSLLCVSTHDSKRSEDVRFRTCILSEQLPQWRSSLGKWQRLSRRHFLRTPTGVAPTRNDTYLLFQVLIGILPVDVAVDKAALRQRVSDYMLKAIREAKVNSSWLNQNMEYENALRTFVTGILADENWQAIYAALGELIQCAAYFGLLNSLTAIVMKVTAPGVPDFYQGTELLDYSLVDPDNRRAVDYEHRKQICISFLTMQKDMTLVDIVASLHNTWQDGRLKLFILQQVLNFRLHHPDVFCRGKYLPLVVSGPQTEYICAFARYTESMTIVVVVSRWAATLCHGERILPVGISHWSTTQVALPDELLANSYVDIFSGNQITSQTYAGIRYLMVADILSTLSIAVMSSARADSSLHLTASG